MISHLKERLELFKIKPFRYYVMSCTLAMFGNGLTYVAMTWLLVKSNHQVTAVAILMACFWLPNIILGPFSGVLVDKYSRKYILLFCNAIRFIILTIFWFMFPNNPPEYALYTLAAITGTILSLYIPAAMTLVREIVDKKILLYANATVDMAYELGAVAGMGAAGLIMSATSIRATFLINAICYLLATLSLIPVIIKNISKQTKDKASMLGDMISGFKYLIKQPELLVIYGIQMLFFVSYMTAPILLAPYAKSILHADAGQFGYIEAAMSVGAVIGGIFSPYFCEKFGFIKVMLFETLLCSISFYFFSHNIYLAHAIMWYLFIGFCFSAWPLLITAAQEKTQFEYQGRVQALFNSISGVLILCFYLLLGLVGDRLHIQDLYWLEVIIMSLSMVLLLYFAKYKQNT